MQNETQERGSSVYQILENYIHPSILKRKNNLKSWKYGHDKDNDMVVISKTGRIGEIVRINNLVIALPEYEGVAISRSNKKSEQYWEREPLHKDLARIGNIFTWNEKPKEFKAKHIDYIEQCFTYRDEGLWFMNCGVPTYITGSHYMFLQWASIDVGYPDFWEAHRILYIFWEACKADDRCYGLNYLKARRTGASFVAASESVNVATITRKSRVGILSKTGPDAKSLFTDKVVPINSSLPFFFKPIMDGMDKPKTELSYRVPASKITKKNMFDEIDTEIKGLDSSIDWKNTDDNSYDSQKLQLLIQDESGKWIKPNSILNNWRVTKTCLRLGSRIIGKCFMASTSNALSKGGSNYKKMFEDSDVTRRNANGQTKSGLYSLFIPMEYYMEGFIDRYGMPVFRNPQKPVLGIDGEMIERGAIDYWEAEVEALKNDADALNEHYRQYPRTTSHAFRDESKEALFSLTKIYQQIDYNDSSIAEHSVTRGRFAWKDDESAGKKRKVVWIPDPKGRFLVSWIPPKSLQNNVVERNGVLYPGNEHMGAFGCDPYDISAVVDGRGSNGALHGKTCFHMSDGPVNEFFLEYVARPSTAEIFFEDVLMACVFYGMPVLAENNKPRLLYHFKNKGYRKFSLNRPDRPDHKLSKTEKEIGGIPNTSEDVKQAHASAIETYIERYVGYDYTGEFRDPGEIGVMPFNRTLEDWSKFDINNRTKHDASISSGLAIMATQKHLYVPEAKQSKISVKFARYTNDGHSSRIMK